MTVGNITIIIFYSKNNNNDEILSFRKTVFSLPYYKQKKKPSNVLGNVNKL